MSGTPLERILRDHPEGFSSRNNHSRQYLPLVLEHLRCATNDALDAVPPPLCVQLQVSTQCSTFCRMCDHYLDQANGLSEETWGNVITELGDFGVRSLIFSGGEPLVRQDIASLLRFAKTRGFSLGLLTNATMDRSEEERLAVIDTIAECVDWVAISIDGTPETETGARIRVRAKMQPPGSMGIQSRKQLLTEFSFRLKEKNSHVNLSATVTLQRGNVDTDLSRTCDFIRTSLGIPQVNFKLVTGAQRTLERNAHSLDYLLTTEQLGDLVDFLWEHHLPQQDGNNLAYLRRSFAEGVFTEVDAANGEPVASFYRKQELRCYTPFLFSLIHSDGRVFPCCHLYRDNHGNDPYSKQYRDQHVLGDVTKEPFSRIWNGSRYVAEREKLKRIDPQAIPFHPCGECTRHCRHNAVLSKIEVEFKKRMGDLEREVRSLGPSEGRVWF